MCSCGALDVTPLLSISGLRVEYQSRQVGARRSTTAISNLDLEVSAGETLAVVGESGSGKTTLADAVVGLVRPTAGSILLEGAELVGLSSRRRRRVQSRIQMVAQNPLLSLSPRMLVATQIAEPLKAHTNLSRSERRDRVGKMVDALGLSQAMLGRYPHELSGGQAQRAVLARALVLEPSMIIFDEPTSALDVSVQAGVLNLLQDIKERLGLTYLFITHDLGVARHLADRIAVMRAGEIVEQQPASSLFDNPENPYTRTLVASSFSL